MTHHVRDLVIPCEHHAPRWTQTDLYRLSFYLALARASEERLKHLATKHETDEANLVAEEVVRKGALVEAQRLRSTMALQPQSPFLGHHRQLQSLPSTQ